jgi:Fe-S-cluster containining protein
MAGIAGMDLHFDCTQCGKCCRNLKLPLTVNEAVDWLTAGCEVQVICEAVPWPEEPSADDLKAAYRRRRSFATMSGSSPTRVVVIFAANLAGACPNLQADMRCGIYERRPLVCRIYPVEVNPFARLEPAMKACPPEAWSSDRPLLQRDGRALDELVRRNIQQWRDTDVHDVEIKRRLCAALDLNCAAVADEGFVVYSPDKAAFLAALTRAAHPDDRAIDHGRWHFVSHRPGTIDSLEASGAIVSPVRRGEQMPYEYIGFQ